MTKPFNFSEFFRDSVQGMGQAQPVARGVIANSVDRPPEKVAPVVPCPNCSSIEWKSNRIPNVGFMESLAYALMDYYTGRKGAAAKTLAAWGAVELASMLRGKRSCDHCLHTW